MSTMNGTMSSCYCHLPRCILRMTHGVPADTRSSYIPVSSYFTSCCLNYPYPPTSSAPHVRDMGCPIHLLPSSPSSCPSSLSCPSQPSSPSLKQHVDCYQTPSSLHPPSCDLKSSLESTECRSLRPSSPSPSPSTSSCPRNSRWKTLMVHLLLLAMMVSTVTSCGPGRGGSRRRHPRKQTPLVYKQHVPNVLENTLSASGFREGKIYREDSRFNELVPNYNVDIVYKDEEGTGADRLMTRRLKEKLNTLSISVMNQWPGVKVRVIEGWDEEEGHASGSLHYEGRAIDITTSDRDRTKYGLLARLAVASGFDWVYYESRYHIHCSVKSEKSESSRSGGCFNGASMVTTRFGPRRMDHLMIGDDVLSMDSSGHLVYSPVIMFLDRQEHMVEQYYTLKTNRNRTITLTGSHLIYVIEPSDPSQPQVTTQEMMQSKRVIYGRQVIPGQYVLVSDSSQSIQLEQVVSTQVTHHTGIYAPLTEEGTIVVNGVIASCYANIRNQWLAHVSFLPVRMVSSMARMIHFLNPFSSPSPPPSSSHTYTYSPSPSPSPVDNRSVAMDSDDVQGVHWYPRLLHWIAVKVLPSNLID